MSYLQLFGKNSALSVTFKVGELVGIVPALWHWHVNNIGIYNVEGYNDPALWQHFEGVRCRDFLGIFVKYFGQKKFDAIILVPPLGFCIVGANKLERY